jgi:hypothetical protein
VKTIFSGVKKAEPIELDWIFGLLRLNKKKSSPSVWRASTPVEHLSKSDSDEMMEKIDWTVNLIFYFQMK